VPEQPPSAPVAGRPPIFNLPAVVSGLIGLIIAVHVARTYALDDGGNTNLLVWMAFIKLRLEEAGALPGGWLPLIWTPVTHAFLHAGWEHLLINSAWLVVFGTPVAQRYKGAMFLLIFAVGAAAGAIVFAIFSGSTIGVLVGASGGISALTGAAVRFIFQPLITVRDPETGEIVAAGRKSATIREMFSERRARAFVLVWLGLNLLVPFLPGLMGGVDVQIAWQAHIGGFLAGLFAVPLVERFVARRQSVR